MDGLYFSDENLLLYGKSLTYFSALKFSGLEQNENEIIHEQKRVTRIIGIVMHELWFHGDISKTLVGGGIFYFWKTSRSASGTKFLETLDAETLKVY